MNLYIETPEKNEKKTCHDNKPVSDKNLAGKFMSKSLKAAALDLSKLAPCYVTYNFTMLQSAPCLMHSRSFSVQKKTANAPNNYRFSLHLQYFAIFQCQKANTVKHPETAICSSHIFAHLAAHRTARNLRRARDFKGRSFLQRLPRRTGSFRHRPV